MMQRNEPGSPDPVSLGDEQQVLDLVTSTAYKLWDAVNTLTRLRPTKRSRYQVTIFGSARVPSDHWVYQAVRDLAAELARRSTITTWLIRMVGLNPNVADCQYRNDSAPGRLVLGHSSR